MLIRAISLTCLLVATPAAAADYLITPAQLAARLGSKTNEPIVLFHLGDRAAYDAGHIAGAQFITMPDVSDPDPKLTLQMASPERLRAFFEAHGVGDTTRIILYFGNAEMTPIARVFVALETIGLGDRTSILSGGLPAWKAAGQQVTADAPPVSNVTPGKLTLKPRADVIVNIDYVSKNLNNPGVVILDARATEYYTGDRATTGKRPGHISGAGTLPYTSFTGTDNVMKDAAEIKKLFEAQGITPDTDVVTYCHIGQQASQAYFAAKVAGYKVHLFDGSFEEWSAREELPVVKGPIKK